MVFHFILVRTEEPLDEIKRVDFKIWLKTQYLKKTKIIVLAPSLH